MAIDTARGAAVAADMERIFAAARRPEPRPLPLSAPVPRRPKSRTGRLARFAAPALVLISVSAVGGILLSPAEVGVPLRPIGAVAAPSTPAATITFNDRVADGFAPALIDTSIASAPAPIVVAATALPVMDTETDTEAPPPPVRAAIASQPTRIARAAPPAGSCEKSRDVERCLYRQVRAADDRLREAYEQADYDGVPRDEMVAVRRMWDRALDRSLADPEGTIRRYDQLALRLDRARDTVGVPAFE